ncbi:hypothetical protein MY8738_010069 [Beauveria namnaoensis]
MFSEAIVTLLALTRTTNAAARITGVRRFLPALAPKRFALIAAMDEGVIARQMDECTSFGDDAWFRYWSAIAFTHVDKLDSKLENSELQGIKRYIRGDGDAPQPSPEVYAYLGCGAMLLRNVPIGSVANTEDLVRFAPAEQHGPIIALDAALKSMAYLFQASWPGGTPKRDAAYAMSTRLFDIILDACASPLDVRVLRHVLKSHDEQVMIYGLVSNSPKAEQLTKAGLPAVLVTNGLEGTNAESMLPFLRSGRLDEAACFFMEMPGTYAYTAPMSLGVTRGIYADAISYIQSLDCVDGARIGMMGMSFGAHWATRMAITDNRLKAVVANGPPLRHSFRPSGAFGMPQIIVDALARAVGANALNLSAKLSALAPTQEELRFISCPIMAINGDTDTLIDTRDTIELAELAPNSCLKLYESDDHCAMAHPREWFDLSIDWMQKHLVSE